MFAVLDDGSLVEVLAPSEIDALGGSVAGLDLALRGSLARHGLALREN